MQGIREYVKSCENVGFIILWNCYTLLFNMNPGGEIVKES